jgi:DNA polymerase-3 subunit epsilon
MIVTDVETTGLKPRLGHSIVSIGAVHFENPKNTFYVECRPFDGAIINPEAMRVNGATWLADPSKPSLKEALEDFIDWTHGIEGNRELAGSNINFDRCFLIDSAERYQIAWDPGHHPVDVSDWYLMSLNLRGIPVPTSFRTDTIFEYVGLGPEPKPHKAITGAKMEAEAFARLLGRGLLEQYADRPIPGYLLRMNEFSALLRRQESSKEKVKRT